MPILIKRPTESDVLTISASAGNFQFSSESPRKDCYLNGFIAKPWGHEYRVYCDYFFDIWKLRLSAGETTSMHCHVRKHTVLLCLAGHGATSFLDGETVPLSAGSFVYIESGVFHRTQAAPHSHLDLIEVENPRNKFDLLRVGDEYGRTAKGYEPSAVSHEGLEPMQEMGRAILYRSRDVTGTYTFAVTRLGSDHRSDATLRAAVLMDIRHHLSGRICLLVPDRHDFTEHAGSLALLIREGTFASTP